MKRNGFTLLEVVVTVGIFSLISVGIIALVSAVLVNSSKQGNLLANNDQARKVAFNLMTEARNAQTSANGSYALATASAQQLIFFSSVNGSINRINYFIQNGVLKKGVTTPSGNPPSYNLAQEVITTVQNNVANGANPLFYYYDDTYNGVSGNPLTQPVNVTKIKFITINLSVYNLAGLANTSSYTVTSSGAIRNLKTNLSN